MLGRRSCCRISIRHLVLLLLLLPFAVTQVHSGDPGDLYASTDGITPLNFSELRSTVYSLNRKTHWLLQVYNNFCGHCITYSREFKQLALQLWPWRRTLRIGVINVASAANSQAMRHFEVSAVPALLYVAPDCTWDGKFSAVLPSDTKVLPTRLLDLLQQSVPELAPMLPGETRNCNFMLKEPPPGLLARGLILEAPPSLRLCWLPAADSADYVEVKRVRADGSTGPAKSASSAASLRHLLGLPQPADPQSKAATTAPALAVQLPRPPTRTDIESALIRALLSDAMLAGPSRPEVWRAARGLAGLAAALLPAAGRLAAAMPEDPPAAFSDEDAADSGWKRLLSQAGFPQEPPDLWEACIGSKPMLRGYPCGLWQLFHTLMALRVQSGVAASPPVAPVLRAFIISSFSCSWCGRNFARESSDLPAEPMSPRQELLWLWRLHNRVNRRLAGRPSEDPAHPKLQFPPVALCPHCGGNEDALVDFLVRWYTAWRRGSAGIQAMV